MLLEVFCIVVLLHYCGTSAFFRLKIFLNVAPLEPLKFFSAAVTFVNSLLFVFFPQSGHTKRGGSCIITFVVIAPFLFVFAFLYSEFMEETTKIETIKSSSWTAAYVGNILILITTQNVAVIDLNIHLLLFCGLIQQSINKKFHFGGVHSVDIEMKYGETFYKNGWFHMCH